jgi:hypothetical protein
MVAFWDWLLGNGGSTIQHLIREALQFLLDVMDTVRVLTHMHIMLNITIWSWADYFDFADTLLVIDNDTA